MLSCDSEGMQSSFDQLQLESAPWGEAKSSSSLEPQQKHKAANPPQSWVFHQTKVLQHIWAECTACCTFVLLEIQCILLVCDDLLHVDHAAVDELPQDFDLADGRDGESFLLVVQAHLLQSHQLPCRSQQGHSLLSCTPSQLGSSSEWAECPPRDSRGGFSDLSAHFNEISLLGVFHDIWDFSNLLHHKGGTEV